MKKTPVKSRNNKKQKKRERTPEGEEDHVEEKIEEKIESESEDDNDDDEYKETGKKTQGRRGKKRKTGTETPRKTKAITGKSKRERKTPKKQVEQEKHPLIAQEDENSLFAAIREEGIAMETVIDDWISRYNSSKPSSVSEVITLILNSSGCLKNFSETDLSEENINLSETIDGFVKNFPVDIGEEYPIISKHKDLKSFSKNYFEFWNKLIQAVQDSILYDETFIEPISSWLSALSSSRIRAFRHTSTITVFTIMDNLIQILLSQKEKMDQIQQQLKTSKKKKEKDQEVSLKKTSDDLNEKIVFIENKLKEFFDGVFVNRFKDTTNHIRALCIVSLGGWIIEYPEKYLNDNCLKYIAWTLYDKDASVRENVINTLEKIYSKKEYHDHLEKFTKKFMNRIIEMTSDIHINVATETIKFLNILLKNDLLEDYDEEIDEISSLIFDENHSIRLQTSKFLFTLLSKKQGKKKKDIKLEDLIEFIKKYIQEIPNAPIYIVDSFYDLTNLFKDNWEEFTNYLLEEEDSLIVIQLLNASVKKICGETIAIDKKKKKEKRDEKSVEEMTSHLANTLPDLLSKYQADGEKIEELIEIPQHFLLSHYVTNEKEFKELLKMIKNLFFKHTEPRILNNCSKTLKYFLKDDSFPLRQDVMTVYDEIIREMISKFKSNLKLLQKENDQLSVQMSLERIRSFISNFEINNDEIKDIHSLIEGKLSDENISDTSIQSCLDIKLIQFSWQIVKKNEQSDEREIFIDQLISLFEKGSYILGKYSFFILCDLLVFHKSSLSKEKEKKILEFFEKMIEKESEKKNDKSIEQLNRIIISLSKSIIYGSLSDEFVSDILIHYVSFGKQIQETIKQLFSNFKEMNPNQNYEYETLVKSFSKYIDSKKEEDYNQFKTLSSKLSKSHFYGKESQVIKKILSSSIEFVFDQPNERYQFFDGIKTYLQKLDLNNIQEFDLSFNQRFDVEYLDENSKKSIESFKKIIQDLLDKRRKMKEKKKGNEEEEEEEKKRKREDE